MRYLIILSPNLNEPNLPEPRGLVHRRGRENCAFVVETHAGHCGRMTSQRRDQVDGTLEGIRAPLPQGQLPELDQMIVTARQDAIHLSLVCGQ